ncbi:Sphinganine C4-monooxygenase 2 [Vitis vinifera]|uniref:Sphinganine C4-monooxygenase 2 n=1 Tax=Vitis vinifera TaxID=29760 RepID=A0A438D706_VITVI|nr:Sphinganine C4-monooxygenase 2 [Vitis vinifera]
MGFEVSDELLGAFVPILVYWVYSGIYIPLGSLENYRLHSKKEEEDKNLVSKGTVVKGVILQQVIQAVVAILLFTVTGDDSGAAAGPMPSLIVLARQFFIAMFVLDTWQYFMHSSVQPPLEGLSLTPSWGIIFPPLCKYNFSQPFFVMWDKILGTYMPYSLEKRAGGGLEARPTKEFKDN